MPRCPLKLISSPSGPWVIDTPGVSVRRSSNLRPSTGVELTVSSFSVDDDSVLVTSMIGTSVTTICCATAETFIVTGSVMVCPTVRFTFSCTVPAVICDCAHPDEASPSASVNTKNAHNNFPIFSPPDITTPISNEPKSSSKGRGGSHSICCDAVYVGTVPKHKCATCGNLP